MSCPLCSTPSSKHIGDLEVGKAVAQMGLSAPLESIVEGPCISTTSLLECAGCGLQYFEPPVVGSAHLYELLSAHGYYQPLRWDHRRSLRRVALGSTVLDLGSGDGAFAMAALAKGATVTAVDFAQSDRPVSAPGLTVIQARADLAQVSDLQDRTGLKDVVTAFHLLEHLRNPLEFVERAMGLIVPGGLLIISVPNRHRFEIDPMQALDCPPHHQTRWTKRQLARLGELAHLEVEAIEIERVVNPARLVNRLARRLTSRASTDWPLPDSARPVPPHHIVNGMSICVTYRKIG